MAGTLGIVTRTSKVLYERISNTLRAGRQGIDKLIFSIPDMDTSAEFAIDSLIVSPWGVSFRNAGEQSAVREYKPGTGKILEVPRTSEKTPITEGLRDSVIAGIEETSSQSMHQVKLLNDILKQHESAHYQTKCKLAIDVIRTGIFSPLGLGGNSLGLEYNYGRESSQNKTYDFTAAGADIDTALGELYDAYRLLGANPSNIVAILGDQWLKEFEEDTSVLAKMQNNPLNLTVESRMVPPELMNTQDLYLVGRYRIPGKATPIWICTYSPEDKYTGYKGATATAFFPTDEAVMFGLGAQRYRVFRGVDVLDDAGKAQRVVGDLVFDSYTTEDPVQTWLRSSTRYQYVPGNINHTARSTGTFSES